MDAFNGINADNQLKKTEVINELKKRYNQFYKQSFEDFSQKCEKKLEIINNLFHKENN